MFPPKRFFSIKIRGIPFGKEFKKTRTEKMFSEFYSGSVSSSKLNSILIIEKDDIQRKGLAIAMMDYFNEMHLTDNPSEANELLKEKLFSVIITDYKSNSSCHKDFIKNVRALNPDSIVIVISSECDIELRNELYSAGVNQILEKPYDVNQLINEVKYLTKKHHIK